MTRQLRTSWDLSGHVETCLDMLRPAHTGYKSSSREWSSSSWLSSQPTLPSRRLVSSSSMADSRGGAGVSEEVGCGEGGLGSTDTLRRDRFLLLLLSPEHPVTVCSVSSTFETSFVVNLTYTSVTWTVTCPRVFMQMAGRQAVIPLHNIHLS